MPLAELNIAQMREPLESDLLFEFRTFIAPINELADSSPGFVWRFAPDIVENGTDQPHPFDEDELLINMSVWEELESLREFAFKTSHSYFVRHGKKWFHKMQHPHLVLWWVPAGHEPTLEEARERLDLLRSEGPTERAFNFGRPFAEPETFGIDVSAARR